MDENIFQLLRRTWGRIRFWVGYALLAVLVTYVLWKAPPELSQIDPAWLLLACIVAIVQFFLQWWQMLVFLRAHQIRGHGREAALLAVRKGVLNAILPAKSGTLLLIYTITKKFELRWHAYVVYMLVASTLSLIVSVVAFCWVVLPYTYSLVATCIGGLLVLAAQRVANIAYAAQLVKLSVIALGMYITFLVGFWCLVSSLGFDLSLMQANAFGVVLNTLALVAVTPANMGVRELVLGLLAPYAGVPMTLGILAGALFFSVRLFVNAVLYGLLNWSVARG